LSTWSTRSWPLREGECAASSLPLAGASAVAQVLEFFARSPTTAAMIVMPTHGVVRWWATRPIFVGSLSLLAGIHASSREADVKTKTRPERRDTDMMGWYGGGMAWGAWIFIGLFWIVLIAAIIWLVVRLLPSNSRDDAAPTPRRQSSGQESALDILARRLAVGEIDLETYQTQRAALTEVRGGR
jgi:putative membrane protein